MLNNTIYKTNLFLTVGSILKKGASNYLDLRNSGGLTRFMPIVFVTTLISAFSISGIQPFNGFVSKEMVYMGISSNILPFFAVLGSSFTLASFIKFTYGIFLKTPGKNHPYNKMYLTRYLPWNMLLPQLILAILCIIFGIWASNIPLKYLIFPSMSHLSTEGFTVPSFFKLSILKAGELIIGVLTGFYLCLPLSKKGFTLKKDTLDTYEYGKTFTLYLGRNFARLQNGSLPFYLQLVFLTLLILLLVFK